jgi:hypothetical protein
MSYYALIGLVSDPSRPFLLTAVPSLLPASALVERATLGGLPIAKQMIGSEAVHSNKEFSKGEYGVRVFDQAGPFP